MSALEEEFDEENPEDSSDRNADDDDEPDVLLTETGNILADVLLMQRQAWAQRTDKQRP